MRPGVNVTLREEALPSTIPTDIGTGFLIGVTEAGPTIPSVLDLTQNIDEWGRKYGPTGRSYALGAQAYDGADSFFRQGGNRLFTSRVVGLVPVAAKVDIMDEGTVPVKVFTATARGVGDWANGLNVYIMGDIDNSDIPINAFRIQIRDADDNSLEESYDLLDATAAQVWSLGSKWITVTPGTSDDPPEPGDHLLAGGTIDAGTISTAAWGIALEGLSNDLGAGVIFLPGATTDGIHQEAAAAVADGIRVAFLDAPDTASRATLIASVKAVTDEDGIRSRFCGMFGPWLLVSGTTLASVNKIAPAAAVAGLFSRNVAAGISPNEPSAGDSGRLSAVLDLSQTYIDADRQVLNDNGVNIIRRMGRDTKVYGWRTCADPVNDRRWIGLGNSILQRSIGAQCAAVGERFVFRQIDGQGALFGEFQSALIGEVMQPLFLSGALFGALSGDAYKVDTGPSVNTAETIANNELHAIVSVRMSPFGEEVDIEIVKYLVTDTIPA